MRAEVRFYQHVLLSPWNCLGNLVRFSVYKCVCLFPYFQFYSIDVYVYPSAQWPLTFEPKLLGQEVRAEVVWLLGLPLSSEGSGFTPAFGLADLHCLAHSSVLLR